MKRILLVIFIASVTSASVAHGQSKATTDKAIVPSVASAVAPERGSKAAAQSDDSAGFVAITNNGQKTVKAIDWVRILSQVVEGKELKIVQEFHNQITIRPGEKIGLKQKVYLSKEELTGLSIETWTRRVEYEDGTFSTYPR